MEENGTTSDSDTNAEDDVLEHYQLISAFDDDEEDPDYQARSDEDHHGLSNGYITHRDAADGIWSLRLENDVEQKSSSEEEEEEEASDSAISRAFREDETRRNAPLTPDNAARVREAMRGVSFAGLAPAWASAVPEDRWIDHLRRLRQPSGTSSTVQN